MKTDLPPKVTDFLNSNPELAVIGIVIVAWSIPFIILFLLELLYETFFSL